MAGLLDFNMPDFEDPKTAGMLQLGLGLLNAGGPSRMPMSVGQGIGQAGTSALEAMQKAKQQQRMNQMSDLQMQQLKQSIEQAALMNALKASWVKKFQGGGAQGAQGSQPTPAGISPSSLAAFGMPASMATPDAPQQAPQEGGQFPLSLNDVAIGKFMGLPDMLPDYKVAHEGFEKKPGSFYRNPTTGKTEYIADPVKGVTVNNGTVGLMPGALETQVALASGVKTAEERAKAGFDPLTIPAASGPVMTTRGKFVEGQMPSAVSPQDQAAINAFKAAGSPGPDKPFNMTSTNGGIPLKTEGTIAGEKAQAEADVKRKMDKPQESFGLTAATGTIDNALKQIDFLRKARGLGNITGPVMGRTPNITGAATNAQADLDTLKSQIGVQVLTAMREASKTGGAVGQVTEREWPILQNQLGSLHQMQTTEQFKRGLNDVEATLQRINKAYKQEFQDKYGAKNVMSEADRIIGAK